MIIKQPDKITSEDKFSKTGYVAEKQMAFYLKRAFADEEMIAVMNGIRLQKDDDVCQIDHLIIHEFGIVIIESKSVTSKVKINDNGDWERFWNNHYQGMRSPVIQANMQADFLRSYLNGYRKQLLKRYSFDKVPVEVLIAISDKGRIDRSEHAESKFVYKADQIAGKIKELYTAQKKLDSPFTLSIKVPDWTFHPESMQRVIDFLMDNHCPVAEKKKKESVKTVEYSVQEEKQEVQHVQEEQAEYGIKMQTSTCPECSQQMEIKWGRYNYYWKCKSCENNVSAQEKCPHCKNKLKIKKRKNKYYLYCEKCDIEGLYHEEGQ